MQAEDEYRADEREHDARPGRGQMCDGDDKANEGRGEEKLVLDQVTGFSGPAARVQINLSRLWLSITPNSETKNMSRAYSPASIPERCVSSRSGR